MFKAKNTAANIRIRVAALNNNYNFFKSRNVKVYGAYNANKFDGKKLSFNRLKPINKRISDKIDGAYLPSRGEKKSRKRTEGE